MVKKILIEIPDNELDHFIKHLESGPYNLKYEEIKEIDHTCPSIGKLKRDIVSVRNNVVDLREEIDTQFTRISQKIGGLPITPFDMTQKEKEILEPLIREVVEQILFEKVQFG